MSAKVIVGDCRETLKQVSDNSAHMVLLDPPHDEWPSAARVSSEVSRICPQGFIICFCRIQDIPDLLEVARLEDLLFFDSYVWHDPQPSFVHSSRALRTHEHILVFKNGEPELPSLKLGEKNESTAPVSKGRSSLGKWTGGQRTYEPAEFKHLTSVLSFPRPLKGPLGRWQKPDELIRLLVKAYCPAGGTVLDPFAGSGTTGKIALEEGRSAVLCEISQEFAGVIKKRLAEASPDLFAALAA